MTNTSQYSCLQSSTDRGAWQPVHGGHKESDVTEHACIFVNKYSLFSSIKKNKPPPPLALYPHLGIKPLSCSPLCNLSQEPGVCATRLDGMVTAVTGHLGLSPWEGLGLDLQGEAPGALPRGRLHRQPEKAGQGGEGGHVPRSPPPSRQARLWLCQGRGFPTGTDGWGDRAPRAFLLGQGSCKRSCFSYKTSLQSPPQWLWSALRFQASGFPYRSSLMVVQRGPVSWVSTPFPLFGISP